MSSGSAFPLGDTINTFTATDGSGNVDTKSFTITVNPETPPPGPVTTESVPSMTHVVFHDTDCVNVSGTLIGWCPDGVGMSSFSIEHPALTERSIVMGNIVHPDNTTFGMIHGNACDGIRIETNIVNPQMLLNLVNCPVPPDGSDLYVVIMNP